MRPTRIMAALAALTLAVALVAAQAPPQQDRTLTVEGVFDDTYVLFGAGGNVGVYLTDEGPVVVDTKFQWIAQDIVDKVRTLTPKPIRYVINTHHHGDHSGGNPTMEALATVIAHRNARANMVRGTQPSPPTLTFSESTTLYVGGREFQLHHFGRGHTNGDIVVFVPDRRTVQMGDLYLKDSFPFIDYAGGGSAIEWGRTIEGVLSLDIERVISGHGGLGAYEDLLKWRQFFRDLTRESQALVRQRVALAEFPQRLVLAPYAAWPRSRLFERSVEGLYREMGGE